jgi:hypothetical protein
VGGVVAGVIVALQEASTQPYDAVPRHVTPHPPLGIRSDIPAQQVTDVRSHH